jgi:beta-galactosidase
MTNISKEPNVHFGAVYFRKTMPPKEDWERDYKRAQEDGHNMFRHWFPWGAIEVAPGEFDWEDYDTQLDLGAKYNINTIIAEMLVDSPEWLYAKYPHARIEKADGTKRRSEMHVSSATGGHHCMCLDNPEVAEAAESFLINLVNRYKDHPGLYGYDIWNENTFYTPERLCYCPATQQRFREWLKLKYRDIKTLAQAWYRFSYTEWDQVELPRSFEPFPEVFDAISFWNDNAFHWMKWRADLIRKLDPDHPVVSHGNARSFNDIATSCGDDFRGAELSDIYGFTYYYGIACSPFMAVDLIRSASKRKEFWRAEAIGNSDWNRRKTGKGPMLEKEKMSVPENIRLDCMISLSGGARGYINPRWRPLLDGPLFGAFGWYGMDGSRTSRSEMASTIAKWCNDPARSELWAARPVKGEIAILLIEEAQAYGFISSGIENYYNHYYSQCVQGAYNAFLDSNIQCDLIKIDQIDEYQVIYLPYPLALSEEKLEKLRQWIYEGGCLVSEGCFGYFSENGNARTAQPNRGFAEIFGCVENTVSFGVDMWEELTFIAAKEQISGGLYRQSYEITAGKASARYKDGSIACVDNAFGKGRTRFIGTMPGYSYMKNPSEPTRRWIASSLHFADKSPLIEVNQANIVARLWSSENKHYVWVINSREEAAEVVIKLNKDIIKYDEVACIRGEGLLIHKENTISLTAPGRDAVIIELKNK